MHNFQKEKIIVNHNWNTKLLDRWLENYEDREVVKFIKYGWPLNAEHTAINTVIPPNQQGAKDHPDKIRDYLASEIKNGSVIGPFKRNPFGKVAHFSPLDTHPKKHGDDLRVIFKFIVSI